ncbi:MAG: pyridoxamine 5'-phosphate oxidase family protein [Cyanobacteria bacterium]|nr:pyridoxamine 5'-phosphate oxidase family protein [Cyanobacteriota bacterium]
MTIYELTAAECEEFLSHAKVGRLGCARKGQPYIVPVSLYFGREERCLYGFSTVGKKIEWMRDNPSVCVEVDAISDQYQWTTVLAMGRYEELDASEEQQRARQRALDLFQEQSRWWLPGGAKLSSGVEHASPVVYRIHISSVSGRRAVRQPPQPPSAIGG